ncbi:hypothetical protein HF072_02570 [Bacillus sp. RO3]|nr:hypothetical protein [Bacillus sp. RO3]
MESLTQSVATIFKKLLIHTDKDELRNEVNHHLLEVLKASEQQPEYIRSLTEHIVIHVESTKALHGILQPLLMNSKYPDLEGVSKLMNRADERIRNDLDNLIPLYQEQLEKEESVNNKVTQLEIYYTTTMMERRLTYQFMDAFGTVSNKELFQPLFAFPAEEVGETILKYTRTYASLLFEKTLNQN